MFLIVPNGCMDAAMPGRFYLSERNLLLRVASKAGRGTAIEGGCLGARGIGVTVHNCETGTTITLN